MMKPRTSPTGNYSRWQHCFECWAMPATGAIARTAVNVRAGGPRMASASRCGAGRRVIWAPHWFLTSATDAGRVLIITAARMVD